MLRKEPACVGNIHASIEKELVNFRLSGSPRATTLADPLNWNALLPTKPAPKVAPASNTPVFPPTASLASPSARHQLTMPVGAGVQLVSGGSTVKRALELKAEPYALVTSTA